MSAAPLLLAALVAAGAPQDTTLRLPRGGTVEIESLMRSVQLTVGSGDEVTVAGATAELDGKHLTIDAEDLFGRRRQAGPIRVTVPSWAVVEVGVTNGSLDVARVPESLTAEVVNGTITTTGGTGRLVLSSATGAITVRDFAGTLLQAETFTGAVQVTGATGTIRVETVNEPIRLQGIRSSSVSAESVNGRIEWNGNFAAGGSYKFATHNGAVELRVPANVSARLNFSSFLGSFTTAIEGRTNGSTPTHDPITGGGDFTIVYGNGGAEVSVETFHGGVRVVRGP